MNTDFGDRRTDEGQRALEAARWSAAREAFESVLEREETPDALDGLGLALWFLGDVSGGIAARERAVDKYARRGRCDDAARKLCGRRANRLAAVARTLPGLSDATGGRRMHSLLQIQLPSRRTR